MKINKLNKSLSTINFVLCFVGYQLATSLFLPASSDIEGISRTVTVPYRALALLIAFLVVFFNVKTKSKKLPNALKFFLIYWVALTIRVFYDICIRKNVYLEDTSHLWLFILGINFPAMFSVMISYKSIDTDKALKWIYIGTIVTLVLSLFNNPTLLLEASEITERVNANVGLQTISFGHLGTMGIILSLYILSQHKMNLIKKVILIAVILLSFFIMLRAGSRSPILALIVVLLFWLFSYGKNIILGLSVSIILVILLSVFIEPILQFMGNISPVIENRLRASIFEGDSSGRDALYIEAVDLFLDNPFLGSQFAFFGNEYNLGFGYAHNIILEALMALGIIGGIMTMIFLWNAVKISFFAVKNKNSNFWIYLILFQQIVLAMVGSIYYNQLLNMLIVFVLVKGYYKKDGLNNENISN